MLLERNYELKGLKLLSIAKIHLHMQESPRATWATPSQGITR